MSLQLSSIPHYHHMPILGGILFQKYESVISRQSAFSPCHRRYLRLRFKCLVLSRHLVSTSTPHSTQQLCPQTTHLLQSVTKSSRTILSQHITQLLSLSQNYIQLNTIIKSCLPALNRALLVKTQLYHNSDASKTAFSVSTNNS